MDLSLVFHFCPVKAAEKVWIWHLQQLLKYWDKFDQHIITVVTGKRLADPQAIIRHLPKGADITVAKNDRKLGEVPHFIPALSRVPTENAAFYAHSKGVSWDPKRQRQRMLWSAAMYHQCLKSPDKIRKVLQKHPCCGIFRIKKVFPDVMPSAKWHYSGTFWWVNMARLREHENWREVDPANRRWGTEGYLSQFFDYEESCCLACDQPLKGVPSLPVRRLRKLAGIADK